MLTILLVLVGTIASYSAVKVGSGKLAFMASAVTMLALIA